MNKILSKEVSLDLAKLLFEKQIAIHTEKIWLINAEYGLNNFVGDVCIHWMEEQGYRSSDATYNAPTIGEVLDFIYENFRIWIGVELIDNTIEFYFQPTIWTSKDREYHDEDMIDQAKSICKWKEWQYSSPLKAYEEAIKFILNREI